MHTYIIYLHTVYTKKNDSVISHAPNSVNLMNLYTATLVVIYFSIII